MFTRVRRYVRAAHPRYRRIYRVRINDKYVTDEWRGGDFILGRSGFERVGNARESPRVLDRIRFLSSADIKKRNMPFFHRRLLLQDLFRGFDILWRRSTRCGVFRVACAPWTIRNEVERIVNEYWIEIGDDLYFFLFQNGLFVFRVFFTFVHIYEWQVEQNRFHFILISILFRKLSIVAYLIRIVGNECSYKEKKNYPHVGSGRIEFRLLKNNNNNENNENEQGCIYTYVERYREFC